MGKLEEMAPGFEVIFYTTKRKVFLDYSEVAGTAPLQFPHCSACLCSIKELHNSSGRNGCYIKRSNLKIIIIRSKL